MNTSDETEEHGRITSEDVAKMRMRIGYAVPYHFLWNTTASSDSIKHFAEGYGDDNPLFVDPAYGLKTRWRSQIAPPTYFQTMGIDKSPQMPPEVRQASKGALRGVHQFYSGGEWQFFRPIFPGDGMEMRAILTDVEEKQSQFGGGKSVLTHNELTYTNTRGEVAVWEHHWFVHTEREKAAKAGKLKAAEPARYTDEDLARIDSDYDNEFVRGADTLYWEDVNIGDPLPGLVKGPLTVVDLITMHMGWGWGGYAIGALKRGYQNRKRIPAFYKKNEFGVWDVVQRLHWDQEFAKTVGVPMSYDYGFMRICWLAHALTNYVGDDGWLWKMSASIRKFNYMGDATWVRGHVTGKRIDPEVGPIVDLEINCVNQRDETTVYGTASVLLSSRVSGPVRLPHAPFGLGEADSRRSNPGTDL